MHESSDKLVPGLAGKATLLADLVVLAVAIASSFDFGDGASPEQAFAGGLAFAGWFIATTILRLYSPYTPRRLLDGLVLAGLAATTLTVLLTLVDRFTSGALAFDPLSFWAVLSAGAGATQGFVQRPLAARAAPAENVLIVGTGALGIATYRRFLDLGGGARRTVVGFLRFPDDPRLPDDITKPILGESKDLLEVLEMMTIHEVFLAERVMSQGLEMQRLVKVCEEVGIPFAVPLHSLRYNRANLLASSASRDGYLHYLNTENKPVQLALKRMFDITLSATALIMLSPILLLVAAAIKLDSPGPVLFKQVRVGLHGAHFRFLKFRSMCTDAEVRKDELLKFNEQTGPAFKMLNDPRVTKVGRFIRKYSIDELPQLINILRGDMTIVGPRPPVPREVVLYKAWQRRRLSVRPGLTCYWQVGGRNSIGFEEWMLLDLRYVDHWTLAKDLQLILQTIPVVLLGKGAS